MLTFIAGIPRKVPPGCDELGALGSWGILALIVSTDEARVFTVSELAEGSSQGGIIEAR